MFSFLVEDSLFFESLIIESHILLIIYDRKKNATLCTRIIP